MGSFSFVKIFFISLLFCLATSCQLEITGPYGPDIDPPGSHYQPLPPQSRLAPTSKLHANPYQLPPSNAYPYHDSDVYYVPPPGYYTSEWSGDQTPPAPADNKY